MHQELIYAIDYLFTACNMVRIAAQKISPSNTRLRQAVQKMNVAEQNVKAQLDEAGDDSTPTT